LSAILSQCFIGVDSASFALHTTITASVTKGVLDIVGITGHYASLAMVMNTTRMSMPPGGKRLSRFPE
jgi:hypothetical protein